MGRMGMYHSGLDLLVVVGQSVQQRVVILIEDVPCKRRKLGEDVSG